MKNINLDTLLDPKKIIPHFIEKQNLKNPYPSSVEFHWCASCNYNCIHCSYGERRKNSSKLKREVILQTIADLKKLGTKSIYLSGGGEPTTLRDWEIYAQEIIKSNIEVSLITNSAAIQDRHLEILRSFNYIAVSIYSTTKDHYEKIVGSNQFEKQFRLPCLIRQCDTNTTVGARCVINSINYREIFDIYKKAIEEGFDYVIFIPAIDYEKRRIDLTEKEKQAVLQQIIENFEEINPQNTNLLKIKANGIEHYNREYFTKFTNSPQCYAIEIGSNAFINYDGEVYLCQPLIGQIEYSIGNLNQTNFSSIWNSQQHKEVIQKLQKDFACGKCENCRAISYNVAIDNFLNSNQSREILQKYPRDNFL